MKQVIFLILFFVMTPLWAQDTTKVKTMSEDISENFDLKAVASAFGEAKDLEEFEKMLNDPEKQLSNLDLNEDGEVDYLRVMETVKGNTHYISVQAVLGDDKFQDVCSIELEKEKEGKEVVQVVGDTYIYGPDYIYQPVYVHPPVIYVYFWAPAYHPWRSPWYWGYRPPYYRPWRPYPVHTYHRNVNVHVNVNVNYNRTTTRYSKTSVNINKKQSRNDYARTNPNNSFENRQKNSNKVEAQPAKGGTKQPPKNKVEAQPANKKSTGRDVQSDWKPAAERDAAKPSTGGGSKQQPSAKPATGDRNPSAQPAKADKQPARQPAQADKQPARQPSSVQPAKQPSTNNRSTTTREPASKSNNRTPAKTRGGGGGRRR